MLEPQYFLHVANGVFVVAYSVKDIMWLRIFALCSSLIALPYYYLQPAVLWEPIGWSAVFIAINGYHVCRLWLERQPAKLSPDEARLYDLTFFPLPQRRFLELVRLGRWVDLDAGDVVVRSGQPVEVLTVPLTESIDVMVGERVLGRFVAGAIIGASAFTGTRRTRLDAVAAGPCRVLQVPVAAISQAAERDDQLARTLGQIARNDLARKLEQLISVSEAGSLVTASGSQEQDRRMASPPET